jgi:hypothetical protein
MTVQVIAIVPTSSPMAPSFSIMTTTFTNLIILHVNNMAFWLPPVFTQPSWEETHLLTLHEEEYSIRGRETEAEKREQIERNVYAQEINVSQLPV